ncbi:MAG: intradiol ring-cleavage dioxygenase [Azospirillum sp.]|nr:intradiol ring-cleavage dioxygenase [Azospirillum sp.]
MQDVLTGVGRGRLSRRQALTGAVIAGSSLVGAPMAAEAASNAPAAGGLGPISCTLTPRLVEGPYYFDPDLERSEIREDREGVPMMLQLQVVAAADCTVLPGVRVDVWHADALGRYSGYDRQGDDQSLSTRMQKFLRGTQFADAAGRVGFETVYPGWYPGRTPHLHFKIFLDRRVVLTGQLFLADALSEYIYQNVEPYRRRAHPRDTFNQSDGILRDGGGNAPFLSIRERSGGYLATALIGVDRLAAEEDGSDHPPPPPGGLLQPLEAVRDWLRPRPSGAALVPGAPLPK